MYSPGHAIVSTIDPMTNQFYTQAAISNCGFTQVSSSKQMRQRWWKISVLLTLEKPLLTKHMTIAKRKSIIFSDKTSSREGKLVKAANLWIEHWKVERGYCPTFTIKGKKSFGNTTPKLAEFLWKSAQKMCKISLSQCIFQFQTFVSRKQLHTFRLCARGIQGKRACVHTIIRYASWFFDVQKFIWH